MRESILFAFALLFAGVLFADDESVARYEVVSKGIGVGTAETIRSHVQRDGVEVVKCDVKTKIDVGLIFLNVHLNGHEDVWIGPDGVVQFAITSLRDGKQRATSGALSNGVMSCVRVENGATNRFEIARTNYVATTLDGIELTLEKGAQPVTKHVFDCSRGIAFDRKYAWVADEEIAVGEKKIACRVIEYSDDLKSGKRWVFRDHFGVAIARQEAKEPSGSYTLKLKELVTRPVTASAKFQSLEK